MGEEFFDRVSTHAMIGQSTWPAERNRTPGSSLMVCCSAYLFPGCVPGFRKRGDEAGKYRGRGGKDGPLCSRYSQSQHATGNKKTLCPMDTYLWLFPVFPVSQTGERALG